jgi:glutathione S-transferase
MSDPVFFGVPGSPFLRKPLLACEEKGVAYRIEPMTPAQSKEPAYLARHPFGRIPAMQHGDFALYEAQAIIRYIDEAFDGPPLQPTEPRARARMAQVLNIVDWYVMPSLSSAIGFNRLVAPIFGVPVDEAAVKAAIPLARSSLKALEDLLGSQRYFTGDQVTLADLAVIPHLELVPKSPEGAELIAGSPPLLGWIERMQRRPSVQKTEMMRMMGRAAETAQA